VLKVQDGCTSSCTYCAVRLVRGHPWSLPAPEALRAARAALDDGCGELVVSGINLGLYAGHRGHGPGSDGDTTARWSADPSGARRASGTDIVDLAELVSALTGLPGLLRLRLSSIEPLHVDGRLLDALDHPRVARHLHLPLQSADDGVLAEMGRPYTFARYVAALQVVRERLPEAMISTDVMVGFPTESAAAFDRTVAAIGELRLFGRVHVFSFSPRPGTPAGRLTPLPAAELRRRRDAALAAAGTAAEAFAENLVGTTAEVLLEDRRDGTWRGYSSEYVRCRVKGSGRRGALVRARVRRRDGAELICTIP
jgi:threonylcarbamoyladenosine tRNA methylthiotransferase MtaB